MRGLSPNTCKRGANWNVGEAGNWCGSACLILHIHDCIAINPLAQMSLKEGAGGSGVVICGSQGAAPAELLPNLPSMPSACQQGLL